MDPSRYEVSIEINLINDIKHHTRWFTGLGIVFLVPGIAAIAFPLIAALTLEIAIGILFVIAGVITLTTLVAVFFLVTGTLKTAFAFQVKPAIGWGLLSLALGLLILFQLTEVYPWILGLLLGIDVTFTGIWMIALASRARRI